jgi:multiple sugar transport system permease protein
MRFAVAGGTLGRKDRFIPYIFLLPAVVGLLMFEVLPFFMAIWESITPVGQLTGVRHFAGLAVYRVLFSDPDFIHSILVTLLWAVIVNPIQVTISLALALAVFKKGIGNSAFRILYFLPVGSSLAVTSIIWGVILDPNGGLANGLLGVLGIHSQPFFNSPHQALLSIVLLASWTGCGYWMVFFLAGLNDIDPALYEAASIDGAGTIGKVFYITIPMLMRMIAFVFVSDTVSNFLMFAPLEILTKGGPDGSTDFLVYYAYSHAFSMNQMAIGQAASVILLIIVMAFVAIELRLMRTETGD